MPSVLWNVPAQEPICWADLSQDSRAGLGPVMCTELPSGLCAPCRLTVDLSIPPVLAEEWGLREALLQPTPFHISSPSRDGKMALQGWSKPVSNEVVQGEASQEGGRDVMADGLVRVGSQQRFPGEPGRSALLRGPQSQTSSRTVPATPLPVMEPPSLHFPGVPQRQPRQM